MLNVEIGREITMAVDVESIPANVMQHVVYIGLRNILMDAHAGAAKVAESGGDVNEIARAMADKKLTAMMAGELRASTGGGRVGDPVRREAIILALFDVKKSWKAKPENKGRKWIDVDQKKARDLAKALVANDAKYLARAKVRVESAMAELATVDVDL